MGTYVCMLVCKYRIYPKNLLKMNIDQMAIQKVQTSNGICWFNK